jgi:hypothetical protein
MRQLVSDTLKKLDPEIPYSLDAENLVLGTGAHESCGWKYRKQLGNGPALGLFQMEPFTFNDICKHYLKYHPQITEKIKQICHVTVLNSIDLITNDKLAICMCRVAYYRQKEAIPKNIEGYAKLWKLRYNTPLGKGTEEEFIKNYNSYVS